ncbi:class I adenylate-forming enzyme family protein [Tomitella fengzijianii]|uniref:Acyl--CoA ligase n=1 Tax=Tomitella fengzijianii TaxID=2597660 RepID=A0A516WZ63_9ACTN|nr:class I adenylate-forming enzyme family protein [Tomitella fengzijianii]QDQ96136.1 acyl--CoA ligase [Tomitella fengzijianii]
MTPGRPGVARAPETLPVIHGEDVHGRRMPVFADRDRSLVDMLERSRAHGDRVYLVCDGRRVTFAEHYRMVAALAGELRDRYGVGPGDRVGILAANSIEWIVTFWATASLGGIAVAMNSHWAVGEIAYSCGHVRPSVIVADERRRERLAKAAAEWPAARVPMLAIESDLVDIGAAPGAAESPGVRLAEDDPAVIIYTSGTTGKPKGVVHSHRNLIAARDFYRYNDAAAAAAGAPQSERRYLMTSPLFHIAALHNVAVPRLDNGETAVIATGRFSVDRVLELIEREDVTHWTGVPTMAHRLLEEGNAAGRDLSSLRSFSLGAAPTPPAMRAALRELLPQATSSMVATYGQTECATAATIATPAQLAANPRSVGRAAVNTQIRVCDDDGVTVPDGVEGEVCVRGAVVMLGYWDDPEATARTIDGDGWLHTGDIGVLRDGELEINSRRSDLIIRGGENIYPVEVEDALDTHPGVAESIVFGSPSAEYGQEVAVVVVLRDGAEADHDALRTHLAGLVAGYKIPSSWTVSTEPLPRNATGKVVRSAFT